MRRLLATAMLPLACAAALADEVKPYDRTSARYDGQFIVGMACDGAGRRLRIGFFDADRVPAA